MEKSEPVKLENRLGSRCFKDSAHHAKSEEKPLKTRRQAVMVGLYLHFEILHLTTQLVEGSGHGETYLEAALGL